MSCASDDLVLAFVDGNVPSAQVDDIKRHLQSCDPCRELIAEVAKSQFRSDPLAEGVTVGRFQIRRLIGSGGMGVVYEAHDPTLNRRVALKLIKSRRSDERGDQHLLREAEAMAQLQHPNVVAVYDVGAFADQIFIAMELVDGVTLSTWMRPRRAVDEILEVFAQAGRGLVAAHAAGLVHGDFKPDNVLIGSDGRVRVSDFGLARSTPPARGASASIGDDPAPLRTDVAGTPAYMAPEQFTGGAVDARTDQFCFCVALYEAIYRRRPFDATQLAELKAQVTAGVRTAPRQRGAPALLRRALVRGLSAAPGDRFPSLDELLRRIAPRRSSLRRTVLLPTAMLIAVLAAALLHWRAQRPPPSEAAMAPSDAAAAIAFGEGVAALRAHDVERARGQLERAVELAPSHALSRATLAEALKALGRDDEAAAEAKRALALPEPPSREAQLLIQGRCAAAEDEPSPASTAFAALFAFRPENVEYGLELAQAEIDDGRPKEAESVVTALLRGPGSTDLRVRALDAVVKEALGELDASQKIASEVVAQARARHAKEQEQEALFDEAIALYRLGHMQEAMKIAEQLANESESDLPVKQAMAAALLGNIYLSQDRLDDAAKQFRKDLTISRALGSRAEITTALGNLGTIAAARGDHAGQVALLEDSIPLLRQRGASRDLAISLASLSDSLTMMGRLQDAIGPCEEARSLSESMHDRSTLGYASLQCVKLRTALGELEVAKRRMHESIAIARDVGDKDMLVSVLLAACTLDRTLGQSLDARAAVDEARSLSESLGQARASVSLYAVQLDLDEGRLAEAEAGAQAIARTTQPPVRTVALTYIAEAALERKDYANVVHAVERKLDDDSITTDAGRSAELLRLAARAYAGTGSPKLVEVTAQLAELARRARTEGNVEAQLVVRLALGESDRLAQPRKGRDELAALADEAEHRGFVLIARHARAHMR